MDLGDRQVPCGTCTLCCRGEAIELRPERGDDPAKLGLENLRPGHSFIDGRPTHFVRQTEDGACIFLGEAGCTIHDRAPFLCRFYDCREAYLMTPRRERKRRVALGIADQKLYDRGRELVERK